MKATLALALLGSALIAVPAMAQTTQPADQAPKTSQSATEVKASPLYEMKAGQWRTSKLDGLDVYNPNNEKIGDISELIVDRDGKIAAVVIGVGGFLGMGEHLVAVPFEKVQWVDQPAVRNVSANDRAPAATGTSTAPAPSGMSTTTTTTTTDRDRGSSTTTTADNTTVPGSNRTTATDRTTNRNDAQNNYRPDHAVVAMTKDQLKALPEVRYSR